jgi:mannose-6-phosphate isomerase-like protein (cupin superfamily)
MDKAVRLLTVDDATVKESAGGLHTSRRLVRREHGSERMAFNVTTILEGFEDEEPVSYQGYDEIVYVLAGEAEADCNGTTHVLKPGSALFVPDGASFRYRVTTGPNEIVAVYSPARF